MEGIAWWDRVPPSAPKPVKRWAAVNAKMHRNSRVKQNDVERTILNFEYEEACRDFERYRRRCEMEADTAQRAYQAWEKEQRKERGRQSREERWAQSVYEQMAEMATTPDDERNQTGNNAGFVHASGINTFSRNVHFSENLCCDDGSDPGFEALPWWNLRESNGYDDQFDIKNYEYAKLLSWDIRDKEVAEFKSEGHTRKELQSTLRQLEAVEKRGWDEGVVGRGFNEIKKRKEFAKKKNAVHQQLENLDRRDKDLEKAQTMKRTYKLLNLEAKAAARGGRAIDMRNVAGVSKGHLFDRAPLACDQLEASGIEYPEGDKFFVDIQGVNIQTTTGQMRALLETETAELPFTGILDETPRSLQCIHERVATQMANNVDRDSPAVTQMTNDVDRDSPPDSWTDEVQ